MKSYKYRLYPTKSQVNQFTYILNTCRNLYNFSLDHRIQEYKTNKKSISYNQQAGLLKFNPDKSVYSQIKQDTLRRLDKSFKRFFVANKFGKKSGFPRFKSQLRYKSFTYPQSGFKLLNNQYLQLSKIGDIKIVIDRKPLGLIKNCTIKRDGDQWYCILICDITELPSTVDSTGKPDIGIDVGLTTYATLSNGIQIDNPRWYQRTQKKLKRQQRILARRNKGSRRRNKQRLKVAKIHRKIRNQREDFIHKLSTNLATNYNQITFEKLNISGMIKNKRLSKSIQDVSWNKLIQYTTYKAESANGKVVLVNPRNTSQNCSGCGIKVSKKLRVKIHNCPNCGLVLNRDLNAAKNILAKSRVGTTRIYAQGDQVRLETTKSSNGQGTENPVPLVR